MSEVTNKTVEIRAIDNGFMARWEVEGSPYFPNGDGYEVHEYYAQNLPQIMTKLAQVFNVEN